MDRYKFLKYVQKNKMMMSLSLYGGGETVDKKRHREPDITLLDAQQRRKLDDEESGLEEEGAIDLEDKTDWEVESATDLGDGTDLEDRTDWEVEEDAKDGELEEFCVGNGYSQHSGECWHDTIQQLFCFSDEIKKNVQDQLFFKSSEEMINNITDKKYRLLPGCFQKDNPLGHKFVGTLQVYLENMQKRFCNILDREEILSQDTARGKKCHSILHAAYPEIGAFFPTHHEIRQRSISFDMGTSCANRGLHLSRLYDDEDAGAKGGKYDDMCLMLLVLSSIFLDDNKYVIPYRWNIKSRDFSTNYLSHIISKNIIGGYLTTLPNLNNIEDPGHAVGFYECNSEKIYYNDNENTIQYFDWKSFVLLCNDLKNIVTDLDIDIYVNIGTSDIPFLKFQLPSTDTKKYFGCGPEDEYTIAYTKIARLNEVNSLPPDEKIDAIARLFNMTEYIVDQKNINNIFYVKDICFFKIFNLEQKVPDPLDTVNSDDVLNLIKKVCLYADLSNGYFENIDDYIKNIDHATLVDVLVNDTNIYCNESNPDALPELLEYVFSDDSDEEKRMLPRLIKTFIKYNNKTGFLVLMKYLSSGTKKEILADVDINLFEDARYYIVFSIMFKLGIHKPITKSFSSGKSLLDVFLPNIIFNSNVPLFDFLLDNKTDINELNSDGHALFHQILFDKQSNQLPFVTNLISRGANINIQNKTLNTPLHIAFWNGSQYMLPIVQIMLNHGANPNITNKQKRSVVDYAITYAKEEIHYLHMLGLLIKNKYPGCELDENSKLILFRKYKSIEEKLKPVEKIAGK